MAPFAISTVPPSVDYAIGTHGLQYFPQAGVVYSTATGTYVLGPREWAVPFTSMRKYEMILPSAAWEVLMPSVTFDPMLVIGAEPGMPLPRWADLAQSRLNELLRLPWNWDTHGARRIRFEMASAIVELLADWLLDYDEAPHLSPLPSGGISAAWRGNGIVDVDLEPNGSELFIESVPAHSNFEGPLDGNDDRGRAAVAAVLGRGLAHVA
jgi:hypothetical protein